MANTFHHGIIGNIESGTAVTAAARAGRQDTAAPSLRVSDLLCSWTKRFAASPLNPARTAGFSDKGQAPRGAIEFPIGHV
jgi:hypothetical protein